MNTTSPVPYPKAAVALLILGADFPVLVFIIIKDQIKHPMTVWSGQSESPLN